MSAVSVDPQQQWENTTLPLHNCITNNPNCYYISLYLLFFFSVHNFLFSLCGLQTMCLELSGLVTVHRIQNYAYALLQCTLDTVVDTQWLAMSCSLPLHARSLSLSLSCAPFRPTFHSFPFIRSASAVLSSHIFFSIRTHGRRV